MSGLAWVGATVGGGAVAGVAVLGAAPALVTTVAMKFVLKDDPILHDTERTARNVGRKATPVGAVGGGVFAVGAVYASGTVAGLSAAGITSGLAGIGSLVGGGMAAGVMLTTAAPAVAAAAIGYSSYRLWKWISKRKPEVLPVQS